MPSSDPLSPLPPSPATASGLPNHQPSDVGLTSGQQHRKHTGSSLPTRMSLCNDVVFKTLAAQLEAGQDYRSLKPAIGISLLAHDLFTAHPAKAAWNFTLRDAECPHINLGKALQVHIIELNKAHGLRTLPAPLRAWIACLLHNLDEAVMTDITHPPVQEALYHLDTLYSDEELRIAAERREQALIDAEDMLDYARHEGEQKGLQKGFVVILEAQLQCKFGSLPDWVGLRIKDANEATLNRWAIRILDAPSFEEVFVD